MMTESAHCIAYASSDGQLNISLVCRGLHYVSDGFRQETKLLSNHLKFFEKLQAFGKIYIWQAWTCGFEALQEVR